MRQYVALLRGINVGGKNIIAMPQLKAAFEEAGFSDVRTYINSGNVIFKSAEEHVVVLQNACRALIGEAFQLDIPVAVVSIDELSEALDKAPAWWGEDTEVKHNAIFVIAPADAHSIIEIVGEAKPEYEQVAHVGPIIFWSAPRDTFSRTRWSKVVSTSAYESITIRNANTTKKLLQLMQDAD